MGTYAFFVLMIGGLGLVPTADGVEISEYILKQIKEELANELRKEMTKIKDELEILKQRNSVLEQRLLLCCGHEESINFAQQSDDIVELDLGENELGVAGESQDSGAMKTGKTPERIRRGVTPTTVAFSTYLSQRAINLGQHQTVPFDRTEINIGDAFDTLLHVFTCPVDGAYYFQATVLCTLYGFAEAEIVKDDSSLCLSIAHSADHGSVAGGFDQGTNAVITTCNKGQRVWVRVYNAYTHEIDGSARASTFSGFLIHEY